MTIHPASRNLDYSANATEQEIGTITLVAAHPQLSTIKEAIGTEWQVWYSTLGKPIKPLIEQRNQGRILLACGVAGFLSLRFAPGLVELYFISLCSLFVLSGLWTAVWYFLAGRNPIRADMMRLKAILIELEGCSPSAPKAEAAPAE